MGLKRYRPPACTVEELPEELAAVVISHTHFDHLDYNSVKDLNKRYAFMQPMERVEFCPLFTYIFLDYKVWRETALVRA